MCKTSILTQIFFKFLHMAVERGAPPYKSVHTETNPDLQNLWDKLASPQFYTGIYLYITRNFGKILKTEECKEATQDALASIARTLRENKFDPNGPAKFETWCVDVAINAAKKVLRLQNTLKRRNEILMPDIKILEERSATLEHKNKFGIHRLPKKQRQIVNITRRNRIHAVGSSSHLETPEASLFKKIHESDKTNRLNAALNTLSPKVRAVIDLRLKEGLELKEIAKQLTITEEAAKSRFQEGVRKLTIELADPIEPVEKNIAL